MKRMVAISTATTVSIGTAFGASFDWVLGATGGGVALILLFTFLRDGFPKRTPPYEIRPAENGEPGERRSW